MFCLSFECDLVVERDYFFKFARSHIPIKNDGVAAALEQHQVLLLRNLQIEMVATIVVRTSTLSKTYRGSTAEVQRLSASS